MPAKGLLCVQNKGKEQACHQCGLDTNDNMGQTRAPCPAQPPPKKTKLGARYTLTKACDDHAYKTNFL